jgi:hypothetical protein
MGLALVGSLISIWTGVSVALIEILVGVVAPVTSRWGSRAVPSRSASRVISMRDNCIMYCNRRNRQTSWQCSVPAFSHLLRVREATYTTLLMATGLTFGTILALFGLQNHIINQTQYTILVSTVILSAFVPTLFAQKFFSQASKQCTPGDESTERKSRYPLSAL